LEFLGVDFERLKRVRKPFEKITYTEAVGLLADCDVKWGDDLKSVHEKALVEKGGSIEDFDWYLDFYKEHSVLHSGCGIGLNRVTQFVLGVDDIRATTAFPLNRESIL